METYDQLPGAVAMVTDLDLDRLLEIAEDAMEEWEHPVGHVGRRLNFESTFDPPTVRALLLRLKRLEAREEKLERVLDNLVRHHTLCCDSRERCEFRREALAVLDEEALAALDGEEQ